MTRRGGVSVKDIVRSIDDARKVGPIETLEISPNGSISVKYAHVTAEEAARFCETTVLGFLHMVDDGRMPDPINFPGPPKWLRRHIESTEKRFPRGFVYVVGFSKYVKIGYSMSVPARVAALQSGCPEPLTVYASFKGDLATEERFHRRFCHHRLSGEWFTFSDEIRRWVAFRNGELDTFP